MNRHGLEVCDKIQFFFRQLRIQTQIVGFVMRNSENGICNNSAVDKNPNAGSVIRKILQKCLFRLRLEYLGEIVVTRDKCL